MNDTKASGGLAIRYRPRRFSEVVGQRHATVVLRRAVDAGRIPQQLLFSGSSGLGKTTLARVVAAAMLCENPVDGDACGECESCNDITRPGSFHPDVIEFDAASHGSKDQIRELATRAATAPIRGSKRIYIIDEAHGLTRDAGSAFLKLLEEPPPHVVFMLATTDPEKMLRTNRGRCIEFELVRPTDSELSDHLVAVAAKEGWTLSEHSAAAVLSATDPVLGLRGMLMTLEKLADALAWGTDLDDDELATLLSVPPASLVSELAAAIERSDRSAALASLAALRRRSSDDQIRLALLRWARSGLEADPSSAIALWRFETAANASGATHWTDIAVCRLATPSLDPSRDTLTAHLADAERIVARLDRSIADHPSVEPDATTVTAPVPAPDPEPAVADAGKVSDPAAVMLAALDPAHAIALADAGVIFSSHDDAIRVAAPSSADALLTQLRKALLAAAPEGVPLRRLRSDAA